jgi:archaellum biogenesis ATPase FlaH
MDGAFKRLHDEINKTKRRIQDLCGTDPRNDKKRIEDMKGGLLKDSYRWVFHNDSFRQWHEDPQSRLLWIKGDPGKGKTMLLCGIIDELQAPSAIAKTNTVSYFFCQATDARINSATAVLRGLLYMLVKQHPSLASHVRKKYDEAGKNMFEDANAWVALAEIFAEVLRDSSLTTTYLIVDALDECVTDRPKLLDFIAKQSSASSRVKWIVSSRNQPDIERGLEQAGHKVRLSLELNTASVSTAVQAYIEQRASELAQQNRYDERTKRAVLKHLTSNANDTFLWVALVCEYLQATARRNVLRKQELFPPGLDALYERIMQQISKTDDAELCKQVLAAVTLVYRPIALKELVTLVEPLESIADDSELREIIDLCGSFLTLREQTVYFVHQSAKDFLLAKAAQDVFPAGQETVHQAIFARSLHIMSTTLRRDMYGLKALGTPIDDVRMPQPDPLAAMRYSCIYWVNHFHDWSLSLSEDHPVDLQDGGAVYEFIKKKYLYWLEALSLCRSMREGVLAMAKLDALAQVTIKVAVLCMVYANTTQRRVDAQSVKELLQDARQFIMYHVPAIQNSPLQVHASALLFSPTHSVIRALFKEEEPTVIVIKPIMKDNWSNCLLTLKTHNRGSSVAFSHDSARLASASSDRTIKIWDASSGECLKTLKGHSDSVWSVAFSHDSARLASASGDKTVKIWDASSGECLKSLAGHRHWVYSVAFSHDSTRLASASKDTTVKIWDASSGECLKTLEGHSDSVHLVAFAHNSARLASASKDKTVKIWDASSEECLQTPTVKKPVHRISFSPSDQHLHTDIGVIVISTVPVSTPAPITAEPQNSQYQGLPLGVADMWLTYNSENWLWLPGEYRPFCSTVSGNIIAIGDESGRIWIYTIQSGLS